MNNRRKKNWTIIAIVAVLLVMAWVIPVNAIPTANFTNATPRSGVSPLAVQFTDISTEFVSPIYLWDFGDGNTSTEQHPSNTYYTVGSYSVNLTVTNLSGESYSENKLNYITVNEITPGLTVTASPTSVTAGTPTNVIFTVKSAGIPISGALVTLSGVATGSNTTVADGNTTISVTASGAGTITATASKTGYTDGTTTVTANPTPVLTVTASPTSVTAGTPTNVIFTVKSAGVPVSGALVTLSGVATGSNTTVADGNTTISVTASGAGTITATASKTGYTDGITTVSANAAKPVAGFSGTPVSGPKPLNVAFRDASTGIVSTYAWNFGDGGTSTAQNPSHIYTTVGIYYVNLTVTGPGGSDSENKTNYITVTNTTTKIGIYKDGVWYLDWYGNGGKGAGIDKEDYFGAAGWTSVVGDWNGDGKGTKIGVYKDGVWYLDWNGSGAWNADTDKEYYFGATGWTPVVGDWNGDGKGTKICVYKDGVWYLDYNGDGAYSEGVNAAYTFRGVAGWTPVVGDWNGNGTTKIGVYKDGVWYLDYNGNGVWNSGDTEYHFYPLTDTIPVVGDWNGDGKTEVGYYKNGFWSLDYFGEGTYSKTYTFTGELQFTPVVGDWNGDGKSKIGVYKFINGDWYLDYDGNGEWDSGSDKSYNFEKASWKSVVGDWNGDGTTKMGVYKDGTWYLDWNGNGSGIKVYSFGTTGSTPIIGDWNGDGKSKIGVYKDGAWYLDWNGSGAWNAGTDKEYYFGATGWIPVVGKWS